MLTSTLYPCLSLALWVHFSFIDTFPAAFNRSVLTFVCVFLTCLTRDNGKTFMQFSETAFALYLLLQQLHPQMMANPHA